MKIAVAATTIVIFKILVQRQILFLNIKQRRAEKLILGLDGGVASDENGSDGSTLHSLLSPYRSSSSLHFLVKFCDQFSLWLSLFFFLTKALIQCSILLL
ncbi:hypothetical protein L596_008274 [Steinernema carpocapsae]|uniref:Uncharacterized protein n=1 Tax=Steinernema carpocapsae TaxID=34508 RepID=A0A4U5PC91_STECR|nr:hypothetical protein L596_008274 [Steinernema carpocapsae]